MKNLIALEAKLPELKKKREQLVAQIDKLSLEKNKTTSSEAGKLLQEQSALDKQLAKDIAQLEKDRDDYVAKCQKTLLTYRDRKNRHWREIPKMYTDSYKPTPKKLDVPTVNQLEQKAAKGGMFVGNVHKTLYYTYADGMAYVDGLIQNKCANTDKKIRKLQADHAAKLKQVKQKYASSGAQTDSNYQINRNYALNQLHRHDSDVESKFMHRYRVLESILRTSPAGSRKSWESYTAPAKMPQELFLGRVSVNCPAPPTIPGKGDFSPNNDQPLELPVYLDLNQSNLVIVTSSISGAQANSPDKDFVRRLLCRMLKNIPPKYCDCSIQDPMHKGGSLGRLIDVAGTNSMELTLKVFTGQTDCVQEMDRLRQRPGKIVQAMAGRYSTLYAYNASQKDAPFPYAWYVDFGFTGKDTAGSLDPLRELLTTAPTAGTSFLFATTPQGAQVLKTLARECCMAVPVFHIDCDRGVLSLNNNIREPFRFSDGPFSTDIDTFAGVLKKHFTVDMKKDTAFYPTLMRFKRTHPKPFSSTLSIPFALDSRGQLVDLVLGGKEGSHAFISGKSGSGKSTLLHTLILSACLQYLPGDLEIWLADYKLDELRQYYHYNPPQVTLIGVSEDPEFSYSFVDRLSEELQRRSALFAKFPGVNSLDKYRQCKGQPGYQNLPVLLVIIDEFHKMGQALIDSYEHKIKLENIFREARSKGVRLVLADQFFSRGIGSLSTEAKAQISLRYAMQNEMEDITGTLTVNEYHCTANMITALSPLVPGDVVMRRYTYNSQGQIIDAQLEKIRSLYTTIHEVEQLAPKMRQAIEQKVKLPAPLFVDAAALTRVPWDSRDMLALDAAKPIPSYGIRLYLGRSYTLQPCFGVDLQQDANHNLCIAGGDDVFPRWEVLRAALLSCRRNGYKPLVFMPKVFGPRIAQLQALRGLCAQIPGAELLETYQQWCEKLTQLNRQLDNLEDSGEVVCFFPGLEVAAKDMEKLSSQPGGINTAFDSSNLGNYAKMKYAVGYTQSKPETSVFNVMPIIKELLDGGYRCNIYSVVEMSTYSNFYDLFRDMDLFRHRVALKMSRDNLSSYIGSGQHHDKIGQNAIYYGGGTVYKLLPYVATESW